MFTMTDADFADRLDSWALDAMLGRSLRGADQDIREAAARIRELTSELDEARVSLKRLTAERDEMIAAQEIRAHSILRQTARAQKASAAAAMLRYALRHLHNVVPDCDGGKVGDACRLAREVLKLTGTGAAMIDQSVNLRPHQVNAALAGRLSQMRVVLKVQPPEGGEPIDTEGSNTGGIFSFRAGGLFASIAAPYRPGDQLWVTETWGNRYAGELAYRADGELTTPIEWWPPAAMPRWASRLTLIVTDVRVQRLQDISEADAVAEGFGSDLKRFPDGGHVGRSARDHFRDSWNSVHGPGAWDQNPWVCAASFRTERANIDGLGMQS